MAPPRGSIETLIEKENTDILEDHPAINAREARSKFSKIVQAARFKNSRVIITEHGEPAAALVSITDVKFLDMIDQVRSENGLDGVRIRDLSLEDLRKVFLGSDSSVEEGDVQQTEDSSG